jgi:hypothetical protein
MDPGADVGGDLGMLGGGDVGGLGGLGIGVGGGVSGLGIALGGNDSGSDPFGGMFSGVNAVLSSMSESEPEVMSEEESAAARFSVPLMARQAVDFAKAAKSLYSSFKSTAADKSFTAPTNPFSVVNALSPALMSLPTALKSNPTAADEFALELAAEKTGRNIFNAIFAQSPPVMMAMTAQKLSNQAPLSPADTANVFGPLGHKGGVSAAFSPMGPAASMDTAETLDVVTDPEFERMVTAQEQELMNQLVPYMPDPRFSMKDIAEVARTRAFANVDLTGRNSMAFSPMGAPLGTVTGGLEGLGSAPLGPGAVGPGWNELLSVASSERSKPEWMGGGGGGDDFWGEGADEGAGKWRGSGMGYGDERGGGRTASEKMLSAGGGDYSALLDWWDRVTGGAGYLENWYRGGR